MWATQHRRFHGDDQLGRQFDRVRAGELQCWRVLGWGSHTYSEYGSYSISIAVVDVGGSDHHGHRDGDGGRRGVTGSTAVAAGTEGGTNTSVLSGATFTDANPGNHTGDFTETINWGDSSTSPGVVSYNAGVYSVAGATLRFV